MVGTQRVVVSFEFILSRNGHIFLRSCYIGFLYLTRRLNSELLASAGTCRQNDKQIVGGMNMA